MANIEFVARRSPAEKHAAFLRLGQSRSLATVDDIRKLANLSNPRAYRWSDADLSLIFEPIEAELARVKAKFSRPPSTTEQLDLGFEDGATAGNSERLAGSPGSHHEGAQRASTSRRVPPESGRRRRSAPETAVREDVMARPVAGKERSQIEIQLVGSPHLRAVAADKGHRKGFRIQLFGANSQLLRVQDTEPGALRWDAIRVAADLLRLEARDTPDGFDS